MVVCLVIILPCKQPTCTHIIYACLPDDIVINPHVHTCTQTFTNSFAHCNPYNAFQIHFQFNIAFIDIDIILDSFIFKFVF